MNRREDVEAFEKVQAQLHGLYDEIVVFSKKNPDGAVNKFKLKFINQVLIDTNEILDNRNKPFADFDSFDEELLPTNSDVVIILSQYINCLEKFRSELIKMYGGVWYWMINGQQSDIRTSSPKKLIY
ncbi:MAG: hypothetical protein P4L49_13225 [Desulfosporosinus sp.]|nr:hypothetical protein [Desulfosporosinus sp.]